MKAVVFKAPYELAVEEVPDRGSSSRDAVVRITTTNICGSDLHPYEGRAGWTPARSSATRTWASSRRSARRSTASRSATGSRCRSTSPAAPAATATTARPPSACAPTPPGSPGRRTATRTWARTRAGRPSCSASRTPTSTCWNCRRAPSTRTTSRCSRTSCPPVGTDAEWPGDPGRAVAVFGAGPVGLMAAHSALISGPRRSSSSTRSPTGWPRRPRSAPPPSTSPTPTPPRQILEGTDGFGATAGSRPSATRPTTPPARSTPSWSWTTW